MLKEDWINYLESNKAVYSEDTVNGEEFIYVVGKKQYELRKKRAYKDIYVPYIRLSHFGDRQYVRDNGWCEWLPDCVVKTMLKKYF